MTNEVSNVWVRKIQIIGTKLYVYSAWEPTELLGRHRTITHRDDDQCFGRIGCDPDPALYDHLPVGPERTKAVTAAYEARYQVAYAAILGAYPEAAKGTKRSGEIEVWGE